MLTDLALKGEVLVAEDVALVVVFGGTAVYCVLETASEIVIRACLLTPHVNWVMLRLDILVAIRLRYTDGRSISFLFGGHKAAAYHSAFQ